MYSEVPVSVFFLAEYNCKVIKFAVLRWFCAEQSNGCLWTICNVQCLYSLDEIEKTYQSIAGLGVKLKAVREENSRHGQVLHVVAAVFYFCPV